MRGQEAKRSYPFTGQAGQPVGLQGFVDLIEELVLSYRPARPVKENPGEAQKEKEVAVSA